MDCTIRARSRRTRSARSGEVSKRLPRSGGRAAVGVRRGGCRRGRPRSPGGPRRPGPGRPGGHSSRRGAAGRAGRGTPAGSAARPGTPPRADPVVRRVRRDLEEPRPAVVAMAVDEVERHLLGDGAGVQLVLLRPAVVGRRHRDLADVDHAVLDVGPREAPAVVRRAEQHVEVAPARRRIGYLTSGDVLVPVEKLPDEASGVAGPLEVHREGALTVAVGLERFVPAQRVRRVERARRVDPDAGLVGVLAGEDAGPRHAAQRVGDVRVRVRRAVAAHGRGAAHGGQQVHREVVHQDEHDVGSLAFGSPAPPAA